MNKLATLTLISIIATGCSAPSGAGRDHIVKSTVEFADCNKKPSRSFQVLPADNFGCIEKSLITTFK